VSKRYQYFIWNSLERNPFFPELCWHRWQELDVAGMREAAKYFIGEMDFKSYCRPGHGRETTVREVLDCSVSKTGTKLVIGIEGRGFLWNMVRIMAGTLVEVGLGRFKPSDIPLTLAALDRRAAGTTAPAHGLFLQWVKTRDEGSDGHIDGGAGGEILEDLR
jgi:tRNA pseudouridine38-40 synthase